MGSLARIGASAAELPGKAHEALDFVGRCAAALPKATAKPELGRLGFLAKADARDRRRRAAGH